MKLSSFTLIKNEILWIEEHLEVWLDHLHEMVFFDGNSTDGTLEKIKWFQAVHPNGKRIKLFDNKDPKDLKDDYVRLFNECLSKCSGDYVIFLHPDMMPENPEILEKLETDAVALTCQMRSFAGEPDEQMFEFQEGRKNWWKNIHRNAFGLHYHGHYGAANEDLYHADITGDEYVMHTEVRNYPYDVQESGLVLRHYSDVRPYSRRINRMITCLLNQHPGLTRSAAYDLAKQHPRVSLESKPGFILTPVRTPLFLDNGELQSA